MSGITYLRGLNASKLKELTKPIVIEVSNLPVAVIVPYPMFLEFQRICSEGAEFDLDSLAGKGSVSK